eukprot:TRINITY_DN10288_c0_g1_i2.p4 TRINITY_DN10288_c0_g1~~TRINITY_DN10288_c0_g1_i2.p4  ORF type:complete len:431 (-),score=106.72 TRINITY_DN10288_c0_g1_i2:1265-2557(-)
MLWLLFVVSAAASGVLDEKQLSGGSALCDSVKQYAGYYRLHTGTAGLEKNYFYWFFESRSAPSTDPLVLWMTGGPGCSSEVALFGENGPCAVNSQGTNTTRNRYSWNTRANLLYIDQPAGTGFSYGLGVDDNEAGVARDMYDFLQQFLQGHPQYQKLDFYAFGESFAGHYVPAVTHLIWKNNKNLPSGAIPIRLKGTSVGNGLTDPEVQFRYYPAMAISTNGHRPAVSKAEHALMEAVVPACVDAIRACQTNVTACVLAIDICNLGLLEPYVLTGMNPYDMRVKCAVPPLCYDFSNVGTFLARPEVQAALGVTGHKWSDCNRAVALMFELSGDWMRNYQQMLPDQLADGIRVLMYAGDQDYICNWLGNQAWALAMEWPHKADFNAAAFTNFTAGGSVIGRLRTASGFSFLQVYNAGHMVPRCTPAGRRTR